MALIASDLELFFAVAASGGFSAAGRRVGLSPSATARRIEAFEQRLGARLFKRSTRGLGLTEAGRVLAEQGGDLAARAAALEARLGEAEQRPTGLLRVSASHGFGRRYVAPHLGAFRQAFPDVRVDLRLEDQFVDLIEEGVDLAVRIGRLPDSTLRVQTLGPARRVLCASPDYLTRRGAPARPIDLEAHDCIVVGQGVGGQAAWRFSGGRFWPSSPAIVVSTPEAAVAAALGGGGLAHTPNWLTADHLARGELVAVMADLAAPAEPGHGVHLVWPERPPAKTTAFVNFLKGRLSGVFA
ncbi:LysR family transcriptional regulator [Caulobacter sp. 1776]|uniref:LysR family transcriptional regulator n=1 Tax=Caulobacter sp. 1776 TaxID=3156420 RepID=UPI003396C55C